MSTPRPNWKLMNPTEPAMVVVCQGPPLCDLQGDAAVAAQEAGCSLCKTIAILPDGSELEHDPVRMPN